METLEWKLKSDITSLTDKLNGAFSYVDEQIEAFTEVFKSANLDHQFDCAYGYIDQRFDNWNQEMSVSMEACAWERDSKLHSMIDEQLET